jgi:hypothetical protein
MMLGQGLHHQRKIIVIAKLRLLRRQQSERRFPAMILGRTEIAPVKASAGIEQVDVNTLQQRGSMGSVAFSASVCCAS